MNEHTAEEDVTLTDRERTPLNALDFVRMYLSQTDHHPNRGHHAESHACLRKRPGGGEKDSYYRCTRCDGEALLAKPAAKPGDPS